MGMCGGGDSKSSTTTTPWKGQAPYLLQGFRQASQLRGQPLGFFPNATVAGIAPELTEAWRRTVNRAGAGSPLVSGAQNMLNQTISGQYIPASPGQVLGSGKSEAWHKSGLYK